MSHSKRQSRALILGDVVTQRDAASMNDFPVFRQKKAGRNVNNSIGSKGPLMRVKIITRETILSKTKSLRPARNAIEGTKPSSV